jgi:Ca2+-binding RTX toxin-like protein
MMGRPSLRLAFLVLAVLIFLAAATAVAAANTVPGTSMGDSTRAITPNNLKPSRCSAFVVGNLVVGSGNINGTNGNDLILGSAGGDSIDGRQGRDCILGGSGNNTLNGNQGDDVLIGGPGDDDLDGGQGTGDDCYGGGGNDTFNRCEAIYP